MAQVFIFNAAQSAVAVHVNNGMPVRAAGIAGGQAPTPVSVGRGDMPGPGSFGGGSNQVMLARDGSGMPQVFNLQLGSDIWPGLDLQLYLFAAHASLLAGPVETVYTLGDPRLTGLAEGLSAPIE